MRFDLLQEMGVLYRGMLLGLMVAAPVGPVALLCIRRTVQKGMVSGFATGFGAAFADAFFSAVAAFGIAAVMEIVQNHTQPIYILGGAFLLFVAWHTWRDKPAPPKTEEPQARILARFGVHLSGIAKAMVSSFFITLTNPATLFGMLALVAAFGGLKGRADAGALVLGIFIGSSLWWLFLSGGTAMVRRHITEKTVIWINRVTAVALTPLALWALITGLIGLWND
ncbi:MAG: LysE family transporter [Alphaproteobacteria bacterium]|nr:LysE family transporter [Alphaproteobacteria bacterium]